MKPLANSFNNFRQGRINSRAEARKQLVFRNNLEKRFFRQLTSLFNKFVNTNLYLYSEFGQYEPSLAEQRLNEEFMPLMLAHYRRTFKAMYNFDEDRVQSRKADDTFVFGRSVDFENVVNQYFASRQLILTGISAKMASRISNLIEQGRGKWSFRYRINQKSREMGLGKFPDVSLAEARQRALNNKQLLGQKIDPIDEKNRAEILRQQQNKKFSDIADLYIRTKKMPEWTNAKS